jgi:hypothetical protein
MKVADHIGAYIEASASIANGVATTHLVGARESLLKKYESFTLHGIDVGELIRKI